MRAALLRTVPALLLLSILPRSAVAGVDRWTPLGPDGGEIWSLAADPDRPGTVYAGTSGGGVWKSNDGGGHWSPTPEGLGAAAVVSLGVSPGRVWAGNGFGLFVLTEGATTWRSASPTPEGFGVALDPTNPDRIWALSYSGAVWLSEDAGGHWERTLHLDFGFADLAVAATTPPTVYVSGSEGLYASTDTGATWRQAPLYDAYVLALDPENPETLYASTSSGVWKTTDQGKSGSHVTVDFRPRPLLVLPGSLLGCDNGLWRSEDDGITWMRVPELAYRTIQSLAADPFTPGGAWLGTGFQGVLRTLDSGRSWVVSRQGLGASTIQAFAFDPFQPGTLYTANWAGFQRSVDAGASWNRLRARNRLDAYSLASDPRQPGLLYAATSQGVLLSRDRGDHWQRSLYEPAGIQVVAVDPLQPGVVYAAGTALWRSRNDGRTWKRLPNPIGLSYTAVRLSFSPHHPGTLYLFDAQGSIFYPRSLSRSTDGGNTWKRIVRFEASSLAFDVQTPDLLYLGTAYGEIRRSRDGGTTWEHLSYVFRDGSYSPLASLLSDPVDPSILYAGSAGRGVWRSTDRGVTWEPLASGMIAPTITCLEADPLDRHHLIACTQGGGLLEISLESQLSSTP